MNFLEEMNPAVLALIAILVLFGAWVGTEKQFPRQTGDTINRWSERDVKAHSVAMYVIVFTIVFALTLIVAGGRKGNSDYGWEPRTHYYREGY
jgi:hypothetical protein